MAAVEYSGHSGGTNDGAPPPDASPERLRAAVEETYGPLTETYERLEQRLRQSGARAVGWAPYVDALRAFRERRVAGDWSDLARLLVDPASLNAADGPSNVRLVEVTQNAVQAVHEIVAPLLSGGERALLLAPTAEEAEQIAQSFADDETAFVVHIAAVADRNPDLPAEDSTGTLPLKPATDEHLAAAGVDPSTGTRPLRPVEDEPSGAPRAPEATMSTATVRPVGEAWRQAWQTEGRFLQRGLVWMEQWPRDVAALDALRAEDQRRRAELDAQLAALRARIDELRTAASTAEQAVADAEREAERLAAELERITAELAEPRAEAQRLQEAADAAAAEANRLSQAADAAHDRLAQIDGRIAHARTELQAAREQEAALAGQLEKARHDLPVAAAEAERLQAASADADAEAHAAYYRAVSAESALSARRRRMTLSQRLHVAAPPPELRELRAEAKARKREADQAAVRAAEARQAAEQAELRRSGLLRFVNEGGAGLEAARQAQQRFDAEIIRLTAERETVAGECRERAREAAQAVDRATQAAGAARHAHQTVRMIEERLAAVRAARQEAVAAGERSRALAATATQRLAEAESELSEREAAAEREHAARAAELASAEETVRRTRENIRDFCGTDPATAEPGRLEAHQRRAMQRIEQLSGYLEAGDRGHDAGDDAADLLLRTADLVCATPLAAALPLDPSAEFDALIVTGAGAVTDAEFLVGAVRTRHWTLLGDPARRPVAYSDYADAPAALTSPFTRCAEAAPHTFTRPDSVPAADSTDTPAPNTQAAPSPTTDPADRGAATTAAETEQGSGADTASAAELAGTHESSQPAPGISQPSGDVPTRDATRDAETMQSGVEEPEDEHHTQATTAQTDDSQDAAVTTPHEAAEHAPSHDATTADVAAPEHADGETPEDPPHAQAAAGQISAATTGEDEPSHDAVDTTSGDSTASNTPAETSAELGPGADTASPAELPGANAEADTPHAIPDTETVAAQPAGEAIADDATGHAGAGQAQDESHPQTFAPEQADGAASEDASHPHSETEQAGASGEPSHDAASSTEVTTPHGVTEDALSGGITPEAEEADLERAADATSGGVTAGGAEAGEDDPAVGATDAATSVDSTTPGEGADAEKGQPRD